MEVIRLIISIIFSVWLSVTVVNCQVDQESTNEGVVCVTGKNYIFTINTPKDWVNDIELARQFKLQCFFYPLADSISDFSNYMYAMGVDKADSNISLYEFIESDLLKFRAHHPDLVYDSVSTEHPNNIKSSWLFSYKNLSDRYQEDVLYYETDSAFIVLSFTTLEEQGYKKYLPLFSEFVTSFKFKGNNPREYLDKLNKK